MEEAQASSNRMENSTAESLLSSSTEQALTRIPFSRASTAVALSTPSSLSLSQGNHGQSFPPSDAGDMTSRRMSGSATLLNGQPPIITTREVRSRSVSPSSLYPIRSQRGPRPRLLRFPTWRRARSANPTPAPSSYASRQSIRARFSQAPTTMSENALFGMYPLYRPPTPMPPRQVQSPSCMARLRRSMSLPLPRPRSFSCRSLKLWYRRQRRNSSDSTETSPDTPELQLRSPVSDAVDNLHSNVSTLVDGVVDGRKNESDTPQSHNAVMDTQPTVPTLPKGHYGPCTEDCIRHLGSRPFPNVSPRPSGEMGVDPKPEGNSYHPPRAEDINEDPKPEDNPYHPYRMFKNKDGTLALVPIAGRLKIGEGASRAGFEYYEPTVQSSGPSHVSIPNRQRNTTPEDILPEIPNLSPNSPFDLGPYGKLLRNPLPTSRSRGTSYFPQGQPRMHLGPTKQEEQRRKYSGLAPPRPSILYPAESRSKEARKHGRVVIPELMVAICYMKLSPDWTLEFDKEVSDKIRSEMLYEKHGSFLRRFQFTREESEKGEKARKIIREFDWGRRCQRPGLNPVVWMGPIREKEEVLRQIKAIEVAEEAVAKELAALNNPSRGKSFKRLIKRTISSAQKASANEESEDCITPIAEETNASKEGGEDAVFDTRVNEVLKPSPEAVDTSTPDPHIDWEAVATLQFSQAILSSMDIEFGPEGNMTIKGDAAQRLLANAVLRIRRDHPTLKLPGTFMTLPTSDLILKETDGNVDIILNHLSHGRWTWITMRNGQALDIDFENTADMHDARMIFRHNNIMTLPIAKFCEGVKDPCRDLSWHEGLAKLGDYLPKLVQHSKYYTGQLDKGQLDIRRFGKYVDLFCGEDVRLAKAVREAVEGHDALKRAPVISELDEVELEAGEPTKTSKVVQKLVAYLSFLGKEKVDSKPESAPPKAPKDSWTLIEEEARDEARKECKPTEAETVGEDSLKSIQDYANPENWNVKDPTPDIPWIVEGPIAMDESLERGEWDIYYEHQIKDAKREKRPCRQLYRNTVLNDGEFGGEIWDFLRYVRRRDRLWAVTAAEEIEWWDNIGALSLPRPATIVGYFPSRPPYVHVTRGQQPQDSSQSNETCVSGSNALSQNTTGKLESRITTPKITTTPTNDGMQLRTDDQETSPAFSTSSRFESSPCAPDSYLSQISAILNQSSKSTKSVISTKTFTKYGQAPVSSGNEVHVPDFAETSHTSLDSSLAPIAIPIDTFAVRQQAEASPASPQAVDMATVAHKLRTISGHARTDSEGSSQTNDSGYVSVMPSTPKPRRSGSSGRSGKSKLDQVMQ